MAEEVPVQPTGKVLCTTMTNHLGIYYLQHEITREKVNSHHIGSVREAVNEPFGRGERTTSASAAVALT